MLRYLRTSLVLAATLAVAAIQNGAAPVTASADTAPPPGTTVHKGLTVVNSASHTRGDVNTGSSYSGTSAAAAGGPLAAGGGAVMTKPEVFLSFWGPEWASGFSTGGYSSGQAQSYLESFFSGVGGSAWLGSTSQYCANAPVGTTSCSSSLLGVGNQQNQLAGTWIDPTAVPASPNSGDIAWAAVRAAQHFGQVPGAVYMVLTPSGKSEMGFGSQWCAWHGASYVTTSSPPFSYAYLPYQPDAGSHCGVDYINSNDAFGHGWFDGFSIVGGHEYAESLTDPFPASGWVDSAGYENADKCAWSNGVSGNTTLASGVFAVQPLWSNQAYSCVLSAPVPPPPPTAYTSGSFNPTAPTRLLDTRTTTGGHPGPLGAGQTLTLKVAGAGGIPSTATSVTVNVTVTNPTAAGYLTVWPAGSNRPVASNLNFQAGETVANLVQVPLGSGSLSFYNSNGSADVIADVNGYSSPSGAQYTGLTPKRLLDTRQLGGPVGAGKSVSVPNLPSGATAVVLNVTATNPTQAGFLTAYPAGGSVPTASNLNFLPGQTVPNRVVVQVGSAGVSIYNFAGSTDVVVDLDGYYGAGTGGAFTGITPTRVLDTRNGSQALGAGGTLPLQALGGYAQVPSTAKAVVLNVTVTDTWGSSYLTLFPGGSTRPTASDLNWVNGETVPNLVIATVGSGGVIQIFNAQGSADVVVDVLGYYS